MKKESQDNTSGLKPLTKVSIHLGIMGLAPPEFFFESAPDTKSF
jgi:hypothetical protein